MRRYRNECKYLLAPAQYHIIKSRIAPLLSVDGNASGGRYAVRSLYYDNITKSCYMSKKSGIYSRYKYRLRMYRFDPLALKFEQKLKTGELVRKRSIRISAADAGRLIEADYSPLLAMRERAIYYDMVSEKYMPCLMIDYIREPYVYKPGNIRITFDFNVALRPKTSDFFRESTPGIPVYEGSKIIMEVKYNDWLPIWLKRTLQERVGTRQSISKYCLGFSNIPFLR